MSQATGVIRSAGKEKFRTVKCILIDLSGTLHVGEKALSGAVAALKRLVGAGLKIRFVTNTTKESKRSLVERLSGMGFDVKPEDMYTSLIAARQYVEKRSLRPFLVIDKKAAEDFDGIDCHDPNAVVIGLAKDELNYENLNKAFGLLIKGAEFIAIHKGRYYRDGEELSLGPGPFVKGLEFSAEKEATVIGKPSPSFYTTAVESTGCQLSDAVMIGDDVVDDVKGAMALGIKGVLVKTGKYRDNDEETISPRPDLICENFADAVDEILDAVSNS